jgi:DNA-binding GntR family transcriptional regulator
MPTTPARPPSLRRTPSPTPARLIGLSEDTLADRAYVSIEDLIISSELPPRSFVSEAQLSKHLQIGRTPVREALKRLELDGLVMIVPSRGIMVTELDLRNYLLLLEVRRELERLIAVRAARHATHAQKQELTSLAKEMRRAAKILDYDSYRHIDNTFNHLIDAASQNVVAVRTIRPLRQTSRRFWFHNDRMQPNSLDDGARTHCAVMMALAAGDEKEAALASDKLMDQVEAFARSTIGPTL